MTAIPKNVLVRRASELEDKCASELERRYSVTKKQGDEKEIKKIIQIASVANERLRGALNTYKTKSSILQSKYPRGEVDKSKMDAIYIARLNTEIRIYNALLNKMKKQLK